LCFSSKTFPRRSVANIRFFPFFFFSFFPKVTVTPPVCLRFFLKGVTRFQESRFQRLQCPLEVKFLHPIFLRPVLPLLHDPPMLPPLRLELYPLVLPLQAPFRWSVFLLCFPPRVRFNLFWAFTLSFTISGFDYFPSWTFFSASSVSIF